MIYSVLVREIKYQKVQVDAKMRQKLYKKHKMCMIAPKQIAMIYAQ